MGAALIPGGRILLRDYGRYDEAQLRFKSSSKIDTNLYVRQDGTLTYYFTTEEIESFCASYHDSEGCSLRVVENFYITRQYANRQQKKARYRVWIHSKIEKIKFNMST